MSSDLHKTTPDGIYHVTLNGDNGLYRMEKKRGSWYFSDGTGWEEEMDYPESIISVTDASKMPSIERDTEYKNTYPLTDFFPKKDENEIILKQGEVIPVFDGHIARFIAEKNGKQIVIEIPIPCDRYSQYGLLEKLKTLIYS